ncbi:bifunctional Forkhead-associated (FHA) domain/SMAD-FHA domain superfamily [Babesia duncani]|uniref:Bifunctional Forkhead-associated (FHA) domain/SMAD-FHA domain superfamily n=1 Tax=Babesia duncani TaxID=323732 RepID=A0AAD9PJI4_9APIC|nr:bifunctional Forkhead-associated (FHA) domain/SMAD-FHA domain superfamily [Babesia duncani]
MGTMCDNLSENITSNVNIIRNICDSNATIISSDKSQSIWYTYSADNGSLSRMSSSQFEAFSEEKIIKRDIERMTPRKRAQNHKLRKFCRSSIEPLNLERGFDGVHLNRLMSKCSIRTNSSYNGYISIDTKIDDDISKKDSPLPSIRGAKLESTSGKLKKSLSVSFDIQPNYDKKIKESSSENLKCGNEDNISLNGSKNRKFAPNMLPLIKECESTSKLDDVYNPIIEPLKCNQDLKSVTESEQYIESDCSCYATRNVTNVYLLDKTTSDITTGDTKSKPSLLNIHNHQLDNCTFSRDVAAGVFRLFFHSLGVGNKRDDDSTIPQRVVVNKSPFVIGSGSASDLLFMKTRYPNIASRHCKLVFTPVDEGTSYNGISAYTVEIVKNDATAITFVNDTSVRTRLPLKHGDIIRLGPKKYAICFKVIFRSLNESLVLDEHINCLLLHPNRSNDRHLSQRYQADLSPCYTNLFGYSSERIVEAQLNSNVKIVVFEICTSYKEAEPNSVLKHEEHCLFNTNSEISDTKFNNNNNGISVDQNSLDNDKYSHYIPEPLKITTPYIMDIMTQPNPPEAMDIGSMLLLNTYTASVTDTSVNNNKEKVASKETFGENNLHKAFQKYEDIGSTLNALKIARLKALNNNGFPIIVDSARSTMTDGITPRGSRVSMYKLNYIGTIDTCYKSTLQELLPDIDKLILEKGICGYRISNYNVMMRRNSPAITEKQFRHNWVFQLDFFDKDDPLFKRAISKSIHVQDQQSEILDNILLMLNRARVVFIQDRKCSGIL